MLLLIFIVTVFAVIDVAVAINVFAVVIAVFVAVVVVDIIVPVVGLLRQKKLETFSWYHIRIP